MTFNRQIQADEKINFGDISTELTPKKFGKTSVKFCRTEPNLPKNSRTPNRTEPKFRSLPNFELEVKLDPHSEVEFDGKFDGDGPEA